MRNENAVDWVAWVLIIIGALNWGLVGFFDYDLVRVLFGDSFGRVVFAIVGLAGLYLIVRSFMAPSPRSHM